MRHIRPVPVLSWLLLALLALAPVVLAPTSARAAVLTFHQDRQFDGVSTGISMGGGSGYALAKDWSAITFLDGASCSAIAGFAACGANNALLVVDSNISGSAAGLGGIAFNFADAGSTTLNINGACANCGGPDGTITVDSNGRSLPVRAGTGTRTTGYDVSIRWANTTTEIATFVGSGRTIYTLNATGLTVAKFQVATANGQYAASSIIKCSINCGSPGVNVTVAFDAPEPTSLALVGAGLVGLGAIRRRRRGRRL